MFTVPCAVVLGRANRAVVAKSCVLLCGGNAARDRLKRLEEGRHPYKTYKHLIQCLGPLGEGWAARERPPSPPPGGEVFGKARGVVPDVGASMVLGQELSARDQADFLALLRCEDELDAFDAVGGAGVVGLDVEVEVDDPFGFDGGDFDSP